MKIVTRKEAQNFGLKRYFPNTLCKNGHISERQTSNGSCVTCVYEDRKLYPNKKKASDKRYVERNATKVRKIKNDWNKLHRPLMTLIHKKWKVANPDKYRAHKNKRRLREMGSLVEIVEYDKVWKAHSGTCYLCKTVIEKGTEHYDHVIPLSRGGTHSYKNIKPTHALCNLRKNNKTPEEYFQSIQG